MKTILSRTAVVLCLMAPLAHAATPKARPKTSWRAIVVPAPWETAGGGKANYDGFAWYRRVVKIPAAWKGKDVTLELGAIDDCDETFLNGHKVGATGTMPPKTKTAWSVARSYKVAPDLLRAGDWNMIAVRVYDDGGGGGITGPAVLLRAGKQQVNLAGWWQWRPGDDASWAAWPE